MIKLTHEQVEKSVAMADVWRRLCARFKTDNPEQFVGSLLEKIADQQARKAKADLSVVRQAGISVHSSR